jgi:hypothetical protein
MARWANAMRVSVPPSPLLSARRMKSTYLIVTMKISAHRMSDTIPNTISRVTVPPPAAAESDSLRA